MEKIFMARHFATVFAHVTVVAILVSPLAPAARAQYGSETEAKAMLEKAVAAMKDNKEKALDMFNKSECGFKDRDHLRLECASAPAGSQNGSIGMCS
jgi:hypothetical protein